MKKYLLIVCIFCLCMIARSQDTLIRVAILDPTTQGIGIDEGTKLAVQELISSVFVNTGRYNIIERSMIDKIIKEQSFQNSDLADNSQATEIGKLAGANKVVLSAVSLVGGRNMLSIKIINVLTARIENQKTKIVNSNDLLDAVEPLTKELLGGEANYIKQNTVFSEAEKPIVTNTTDKNSLKSKNSSVSTGEKGNNLLNEIEAGIAAVQNITNPKLEKLISSNKLQTKMVLGTGLSAELNSAGVLTISGNGVMYNTDQKLLAHYSPYITAIVIEEGITKICGFEDFSKLQFARLPNSLTVIDNNCFSGCELLLAVNIPPKVNKIGDDAFENCEQIAKFFIPNSVEFIGEGAFSGCDRLIEVHLSENISIISAGAFEGCHSLSKIECPESVQRVEHSAFESCDNLSEITFLSPSMTVFEEECFEDCESLGSIILNSTRPPQCSRLIFGDLSEANAYFKRITLTVPTAAIGLYRSDNQWKKFERITHP